jgi:16S rRNA (cytosine1402-N4)-methyltransferase
MRHIPVLLSEVLDSLQLKPGMSVIDCTLGDAGHAEALLKQIAPEGKLLGIDADQEAVERAQKFLSTFKKKVTLIRDNFAHLEEIAQKTTFYPVDAILMDLGWSSPQFKERNRGFSFDPPAGGQEPLDMRYAGDDSNKETAAELVNNFKQKELEKIFRQYGEEKLSKEIAEAIVRVRRSHTIQTTSELVEIILEVYRTKLKSSKEVPWVGGIHPATKVFQALRIAVNKELEVLKQVLPQATRLLAPGGRLAVITFHSLEDRIVKHYFQTVSVKDFKIITKKPLSASEQELLLNPRARSAKLRVIEKK